MGFTLTNVPKNYHAFSQTKKNLYKLVPLLFGVPSGIFFMLYQEDPSFTKDWWLVAESTIGVVLLVYFTTSSLLKKYFMPKKSLQRNK
ncbi:hypothetical protein K0U07_03800 [bacterium]|nr:hypothetical protein [bacterium]